MILKLDKDNLVCIHVCGGWGVVHGWMVDRLPVHASMAADGLMEAGVFTHHWPTGPGAGVIVAKFPSGARIS